MPAVHPPPQALQAEPRETRQRVADEYRAFAPPGHDSLSFPFLAGRVELSVRLTARPLFDLQRRTRIGLHVSRALSRAAAASGPFGGARPRLEPPDILRLDAATLQQTIEVLRTREPGAVVVPVCLSTAASSRGRFALTYAAHEYGADGTRLLIEVTGLGSGTSPADLADVVNHIEAQQTGVLVRTPAEPAALAPLVHAGLRGLSLDLSPLDLGGIAGRQQASQLIRTARLAAPSLLVLGLPAELAEEAAQAGATHAVMEERFAVTV